MPKDLVFPGGALIGCSAGFVNVPKHQGQPLAMKTGIWPPNAFRRAGSTAATAMCWTNIRRYGAILGDEGFTGAQRQAGLQVRPLGGPGPTAAIDTYPVRQQGPGPAHRARSQPAPAAERQPQDRIPSRTASDFDVCPQCFSTPTTRKTSRRIWLKMKRCRSRSSEHDGTVRAPKARLPGRASMNGRRRAAPRFADQLAELPALQNLRHQGPDAKHCLDHAGRWGWAELPRYVIHPKT